MEILWGILGPDHVQMTKMGVYKFLGGGSFLIINFFLFELVLHSLNAYNLFE